MCSKIRYDRYCRIIFWERASICETDLFQKQRMESLTGCFLAFGYCLAGVVQWYVADGDGLDTERAEEGKKEEARTCGATGDRRKTTKSTNSCCCVLPIFLLLTILLS